MYYLNSRYYNPEWGRFINADGLIGQVGDLLGHNMFAYCGNNPINMADPSVRWFVPTWLAYGAGIIIKAAVVAVGTYVAGVATHLLVSAVMDRINSQSSDAPSSSGGVSSSGEDTAAGGEESSTPTGVITTNAKSSEPTVNVKGRKKWKSEPVPMGLRIGINKLPSRDMVKRPIVDSNGKPVGEMHYGQPEYNYNPNGTKTPTGRVYPDHYHLNWDPMHYIP